MIPKIIHQIWLDPPMPEQYAIWRQGFVYMHPDWEVKLWTRETLPDFQNVMSYFDLNGYHPTVATDIFRVLLLIKYGGFYADCDAECLRPLNELRDCNLICSASSEVSFAGHPLRINSGDGFGAEDGNSILIDYIVRCVKMRNSTESVLYKYGFLGLSEVLWERRNEIVILLKEDMAKFIHHEAKGLWFKNDNWRVI